MIANNAIEISFDRLGRIRIPDFLIDYAGLGKQVVVAGSLNRIEIWNQAVYKTYMQELNNKSEEIAEAIETLT